MIIRRGINEEMDAHNAANFEHKHNHEREMEFEIRSHVAALPVSRSCHYK